MEHFEFMTMLQSKSSQIESFGHDPATGVLRVRFRSGGLAFADK